ncbi:FecR domain-containing protein [Nostoc sp. UHCC 0702]|nr:FecR domain-containing protein [Nostoc sp. UHCC 0702]
MFCKSFLLSVIGLWGVLLLPLSNQASAITPLTRAEIQNLQNLVQLIPRNNQKIRPAKKLDAMIPGDGLSTGRASLADLRFNDGSLARIGEQAVFQFLPKTRDFRLSNGTVLLLIPPGRGRTRIQTPSAAAAIRGSALFVRYNKQTDTTIVGALTNSGIEVYNKDASQTQVLQAGQLIVLVKGEFQSFYDFDLRNFYETSELVRELDLNRQNPAPTLDHAISSVQAETAAALKAQPPITGNGLIENPSFVQLTSPSNSRSNQVITENSSTNSSKNTGQAPTNTQQQSQTNGNNSNLNTQNNNTGVDSSKTSTQSQTSTPKSTPSQSPTQTNIPQSTPSQPPTQTNTPQSTPSPESAPSELQPTTPQSTPSPESAPSELQPTTPESTPSPESAPSESQPTTPESTPSPESAPSESQPITPESTPSPESAPSESQLTTPESTPSPESAPSESQLTTPESTPSPESAPSESQPITPESTPSPESAPSESQPITPESTPSESQPTTPESTPSESQPTTPESTPSESQPTTPEP